MGKSQDRQAIIPLPLKSLNLLIGKGAPGLLDTITPTILLPKKVQLTTSYRVHLQFTRAALETPSSLNLYG